MTITQFITPLPAVPDPASDTVEQFSDKAAAFVLAQKDMADEFGDALPQVNATLIEMNADASASAAAAAAAAVSQASAAASAASAIASPSTNGTSTTSLTIGAGTQSLTTQTGKNWAPGMWINCVRTSDRTKSMSGYIDSYNSGTGALVLIVVAANTAGSGTFTDWTLTVAGLPGSVLNLVDLSLVGPSSLPSLLADFANAKRLPAGFVYTMTSPQTYFDAMGVMRTAAAGVPAFDHDPVTGESLGIQMFEARTNLLLRSEELDNAAWAKSGSTVTANSEVAPNGTTTMDKIVESAISEPHFVAQDVASQPAGSYTFSLFVKPAGRTKISLLNAAGSGNSVIFDLVAMTATTDTGGATGRIVTLPAGVYRLEMTFTTSTSLALSMRGYLMSGGAITYAGDGVSGMHAWGAQLEAGAFATPYIPTTSATVTRTMPQLYINTDTSWFNALEGTLYAKSTSPITSADKVAAVLVSTFGNFIYVGQRGGVAGGSAAIQTSSISQISLQDSVASDTSAGALAYKFNDGAISLNGASAYVDGSVNIPSISALYVGSLLTSSPLNGRIPKVAYWPRRLPNAELTALTTQ